MNKFIQDTAFGQFDHRMNFWRHWTFKCFEKADKNGEDFSKCKDKSKKMIEEYSNKLLGSI